MDLLISDLHLSPERPAVDRAFFRFLEEQASKADALYILGDLFEAWIGDDDPSPHSRAIIEKLRAVTEAGTALYFQHGNRDFMIGKRFARETGAILLPDEAIAELAGQKVLLMHGDTLCLDDQDYQRFRRRVRNPVAKWLLRRIPLAKRQKMAVEWRSKSMTANANKAANIMDVSPAEVERMLQKHQVATLIHGHTHRPGQHRHQHGERIVLGDWHSSGWVIRAGSSGIELVEFTL